MHVLLDDTLDVINYRNQCMSEYYKHIALG
jgi:hypothetical protein